MGKRLFGVAQRKIERSRMSKLVDYRLIFHPLVVGIGEVSKVFGCNEMSDKG